MYIIGAILLVVGVAGCIYGYTLNNSWEAQLSSLFEYGYSNPGTIFIIVGAVCAVLGVVFIIAGIVRKKDTKEYVLICSACGADNISTDKNCKRCKECNGAIVYSGLTKTEWLSLGKDERKSTRDRIMSKASIEKPPEAKPTSKRCANCGKEVSAAAKFCPHCGKDPKQKALPEIPRPHLEDKPSTETPPIIPTVAKTACPHCGKMISETAAFCPYCGEDPKKAVVSGTVSREIPEDLPTAATEDTTYCPHCGNSIKASAAFCPHCSKDVRRETKKPQLVVNFSRETPNPESPPVAEIIDTSFEDVAVVEAPTSHADDKPEPPIEDAYQGKHLKKTDTPEEPKAQEDVLNLEKESIPETPIKEEPAPAPRNNGFSAPEDLD